VGGLGADGFEGGQVNLEHMVVEKEQGGEGLVLSGSGHLVVHGEMG